MTGLLWSEYKNVYLKRDHKSMFENNIAGIDLEDMPLWNQSTLSLHSFPPFFIIIILHGKKNTGTSRILFY